MTARSPTGFRDAWQGTETSRPPGRGSGSGSSKALSRDAEPPLAEDTNQSLESRFGPPCPGNPIESGNPGVARSLAHQERLRPLCSLSMLPEDTIG